MRETIKVGRGFGGLGAVNAGDGGHARGKTCLEDVLGSWRHTVLSVCILLRMLYVYISFSSNKYNRIHYNKYLIIILFTFNINFFSSL